MTTGSNDPLGAKMRLNDLEKQGIPPRIIECWIERQGESLLPVQSKAVRKGILGQCGSNEQKEIKMVISVLAKQSLIGFVHWRR